MDSLDAAPHQQKAPPVVAPLPNHISIMAIAYGTAGFRDKATVLPTVCERVGMLAALRSRYLGSKTVGVMITASHNPPGDNGAKIVEPLGEMLEQSWESYATELANASDPEPVLTRLYSDLGVSRQAVASVVVGRDTRASGPELVERLEIGLDDAKIENIGQVTTPQLHYVVRARNDPAFGEPSIEGYYHKLSTAFQRVIGDRSLASVVVDCANGVGAPHLSKLAPFLPMDVEVVNSSTDPASLNVGCGADYVKTNQNLPNGITPVPNQLYASFDGDADRVVFYYVDESAHFYLLDGDKIATLAADFLRTIVPEKTHLGAVQTAYANGASTAYLAKNNVPVVCTPTGVKHLHHAAVEFDVGVYFEANGHGTVVFKPEFVAAQGPDSQVAAFNQLINQAVGDAISDLLMVIAILAIRGWSPSDWNTCYTDLPNKLLKANVRDRTMFKTTDAERRLLSPSELQPQLDQLMAHYPSGRTFVRASGTEDVVRIYAEAATRDATAELASKVQDLLKPFN